jgi:hypothetical protein
MFPKGCLKQTSGALKIYNSVRLTCAAALDPQRIVLGFYVMSLGYLKAGPDAEHKAARTGSAAVRTLDGGKTWQGLDGEAYPTVMGGNITKSSPLLLDLGADIMGVYPFGCGGMCGAHIGYPTDRAFFVRTVFTGDTWWNSPKYFVSGDPRHCHWMMIGDVVATPPASAEDIAAGRSGTLWTGWTARNRNSYGHIIPQYSTGVYRSDDGGATWSSWRGAGLSGELPESVFGKGTVRVAPYRGQVAVFGGKRWTWFDGTKWAPAEETGTNCWHAVSCGEEIYLSHSKGPSRWYDGKVWRDFSAPGRAGKGGMIAVCGGTTALFVETDESGKRLLCWRKKQGTSWEGPRVLVTEADPISQIAVQRYAPKGFAPVAYMCVDTAAPVVQTGPSANLPGWPYMAPMDLDVVHHPWIKVLVVPAEIEAGK